MTIVTLRDKLLTIGRRIIPSHLFRAGQPIYHWLLAVTGALAYRYPARHINLVLVTGTKGKSTVTEMVNAVLEAAGQKTALANTIRHKIGPDSKPNKFKMTIPGRWFLQRWLRQAVRANCRYAIVEMTSEGAKQFRHLFLAPNALIFTNLSPEHIESHGSYEKYLAAKLKIAKALERSQKKNKILVVNNDDPQSIIFRRTAPSAVAYPFDPSQNLTVPNPLPGVFNRANWQAALTYGQAIGIEEKIIQTAIAKLTLVPGRLEPVITHPFTVIVDYAHTVDSLRKVYETYKNSREICVLGGTGGGRDSGKRPAMGAVADQYCAEIILTNEDPYDEDPETIIEQVEGGIKHHQPKIILDRREAIHHALTLARPGDVVLITGKGTDPYIMEAGGQRTPWSDAQIAREEYARITRS